MSEPTISTRIESAYFLMVDIDLSVAHFVEAIDELMRGNVLETHWHLWRGGFAKTRPEQPEFEPASEPQAQPTLFGAQGER